MEQVLRLNSTDQRITYSNNWKSNSNTGQNGTYSSTTSTGAELFFLFRGTSVRFYGRLGGGGGNVVFRLDTNTTLVSLNGTNFDSGPTRVWNADNLGDGEHQLWVVVNSLQQSGSVAVDYFEVENSSGHGFDLLWAGPNATNVPKEAIIVDNSSTDVVFSNPSLWGSVDNAQYYGRSLYATTKAGASLTFTFEGVAIWYYADLDTPHGFYTVSIDGSQPERLSGKNEGGQLTQLMLWSKTDLSPGKHIFTLRHDDLGGTYVTLDFFRVLRADNASALPSSTATNSNATAPGSTSNVVPLAVGLTFGLLGLAIAVLIVFYLRRRRGRKTVFLDVLASPRSQPPPTLVDQQSGWMQGDNRFPQTSQAFTLGSTLSSGVPTTTAVSTMSIGTTELEGPPSYESHVRPARVPMTKR